MGTHRHSKRSDSFRNVHEYRRGLKYRKTSRRGANLEPETQPRNNYPFRSRTRMETDKSDSVRNKIQIIDNIAYIFC